MLREPDTCCTLRFSHSCGFPWETYIPTLFIFSWVCCGNDFDPIVLIVAATTRWCVCCTSCTEVSSSYQGPVTEVTCLRRATVFGKLSSRTRSMPLNGTIAVTRCLCCPWSICKSSRSLFTDSAGSSFVQGLSSFQGQSPPSDSSSQGDFPFVVCYILMQPYLWWFPFQH